MSIYGPGRALINRPVRMPRRPEPQTPWTKNASVGHRIATEEPTAADYPFVLQSEDWDGIDNTAFRILQEY